MRKLFIKIIQLLDGTPAVYGKRQSGQSVVELALITPILIVLLAGLVEIGWFANNYLNLLDVTRAGARRGAVLQDQKSPLFWDNFYSYVPNALLPANYQMAYDGTNGTDAERFYHRWMPNYTVSPYGIEPCDTGYRPVRPFYSEVICTMITTMDPMELDQENGIDDIIISGFSMQVVDPSAHPTWLAAYPGRAFDPGVYGQIPQSVVAGRYPTNANECDVRNVAGTPVIVQGAGRFGETRDPFDIDGDNHWDIAGDGAGSVFTEIFGYDAVGGTPGSAEKQVGFSLFGNHRIPGTFCVGSEWTMTDLQNLMNLSNYELSDDARRNSVPSQGVVIAEIYWEHEMLLKLPLLSPVFIAVGDPNGKMVINIWAAFPMSSVEPHILFP